MKNLTIKPDTPLFTLTVEQYEELMARTSRRPELEQPAQPEKKLLDINGFCELTGYKKATAYALIHKRKVPYFKPPQGSKVFFRRDEIEAWMLQNRTSTIAEVKADALDYVMKPSDKAKAKTANYAVAEERNISIS